ncbi:MAG: hypothetical protein K2G83_03395, partial [Ruminococcus sp.]|nr:hypothetical protein [Ruminococcus sp.]
MILHTVCMLTGCDSALNEIGFSKASAGNTENESETSYDDVYNGIVESLQNMKMISEHRGSVDRYDVGIAVEKIIQTHPEFLCIDGYTT